MSKLSRVISMNRDTFYRYDTGARRTIVAIYLPMAAFGSVLSLVYGGASDSFSSAVIATQAILIGFAFTVIFQIGTAADRSMQSSDSIESKLKQERLKKLTSEIFYNSSYFILTALGCVAFALALLLHTEREAQILKFGLEFLREHWAQILPNHIAIFDKIVTNIRFCVDFFIPAGFYFLLVDSLYTFLRAVGRVIFLFERRVT